MPEFMKFIMPMRIYSEQAKRGRLLKELQSVEQVIQETEKDLARIEVLYQRKEESVDLLSLREKHSKDQSVFSQVRGEFEEIKESIASQRSQVNKLRQVLSHLEILLTYKTSPELVEQFYSRPATVRISHSLLHKLTYKKDQFGFPLKTNTGSEGDKRSTGSVDSVLDGRERENRPGTGIGIGTGKLDAAEQSSRAEQPQQRAARDAVRIRPVSAAQKTGAAQRLSPAVQSASRFGEFGAVRSAGLQRARLSQTSLHTELL